MLRSAINNATLMAAARRSLAPSPAAKASLSTLSLNLSSADDICEDISNHTYKQVALTNNDSFTNNMKSSICNLFANLSGDVTTLVSLHQTQSQIEEENYSSSSDLVVMKEELGEESPLSLSVWLISTLKRRKKMMNKHKLRKRRKKLRLKTRRG
mmetsp:Transcript_10563/g.15103  ORF Transcript_10563/g.15103 Transcript_10563/m.15103 type:complete len:155 (+) Transcript_10563:158-622(+)